MVVFLVSVFHAEFSSAHITLVCIDEGKLFFAPGNGTASNGLLQTRITMESDMFFDLCVNSNGNANKDRGTNIGEQLY